MRPMGKLDSSAPENGNGGMPLLEVKDLHVRYGRMEAVKGVSFNLARSETLGIVGESGSGKSTIAKALIGIEKPFSGEIVSRATSMQMVFQDAVGSLNPRMTVRQTLEETLKIKHNTDQTAAGLLDIVGLSAAVLEQYPREMSGGQCQRVSIARALACKPEVLIADEPVSALDVSVQARILNLLRELRRNLGLSILLIAHDLAVVKNVCDRVCVMQRGEFVDMGTSDEVFNHPTSDYTKRLLAAVPDVARALAARQLSSAAPEGAGSRSDLHGTDDPVLISWRPTADTLVAEMVFQPNGRWFAGHFPDFPVLPGVTQLFFMRRFARRAFPDFQDAGSYRHLKFRRPVRPGEHVTLEVGRKGTHSFSFRMSVGGEIASSGQVEGGGLNEP